MCFEAEWKREVVQDYKWDYVDVREFRKTDFGTRFKYSLVYLSLLRDLAIIGLDVFTCVTMLSSDDWKTAVFANCKSYNEDGVLEDKCNKVVQFNAARWVFVGCIFFSFLLYGYEFYKARRVVLSRDVSYSYTNIMANDYYSIKDYNNFCLFCHLGASKKRSDTITFFVFFTFKNWKRVCLADGPRQCINGIMLVLVVQSLDYTTDWPKYWNNSAITFMLLLAMLTTVLLFAFSFIQIVIAAFLYLPVLFYIQGNLKEYVCHKVDKRMGEVMRRMQKARFNRAVEFEKKLAKGETITNSRGEEVDAALLQPTLPTIMLDDDKFGSSSGPRSRTPAQGRPVSPAHGKPMNPVMLRAMSPAPPMPPMQPPSHHGHQQQQPGWGVPPQPQPKPQQHTPPTTSHEVTEMDIYDAYTDDNNSVDDHSFQGHGGYGTNVDDHHSFHGHGSQHGHGHFFGKKRDADGLKTSLLGGAAPMGHSYPPPPASAPTYPPQPSVGAPSYPPGASLAPPHRAGGPPAPVSRAGAPGSAGQVAPYNTTALWSQHHDMMRSPPPGAPGDLPLKPMRYDGAQQHGW